MGHLGVLRPVQRPVRIILCGGSGELVLEMLDEVLNLESASALHSVLGPLDANIRDPVDGRGLVNGRVAKAVALRHLVVLHLVEALGQRYKIQLPSFARLHGILRMLCASVHADIHIRCAEATPRLQRARSAPCCQLSRGATIEHRDTDARSLEAGEEMRAPRAFFSTSSRRAL